ncbi:hypothetical protein [Psychroserpens mesophilus]|uniref:hypothetical protein n=1 Tax=Psychroserpens mesophilus TaxID=325473 RepID=UPI003D64B842
MNTISIHKIDSHRRLCIQKDLKELSSWISNLEWLNSELDHFKIIEKQLLHNNTMSIAIQAIRRKNILNMANLCKYEQELKVEFEYGKIEYDATRLKFHEHKCENYLKFIEEYNAFKHQFYVLLKKYQRK